MEMKIVGVTLAAFVSLVVLAAVLVPVLDDSTATTDKFTNEGYFTMDKVGADADFVLTVNYGNSVIDINGVEIDMSQAGLSTGKTYTIMGGDNFVLRYVPGSNPYVQYFGDQSVTPNFLTAVTAGSKFTATVSNGSIVFASTDPSYPNSATLTLSDNTYCINPNGTGAYTMKKMDGTAYIEKNTSIIILDGITSLYATDVGIYAEGTIDGALDASTFRGTGTYDVTFDDFTYTATDVSNYIDLVKLEKVDFVATQNSTDYDVTYSYFIVPTEVSAERAVHLSGNQIELLDVIPILVIVAILLGVIALVIRSKLD